MKYSVKDINSTKKKLSFEIPSEDVKTGFKHAAKTVGGKANLKGFRKGKVPFEVLEKYYGPDLKMEAVNYIVSQSYPKALEELKVYPIIDPKFDIKPLENDQDYTFDVEIEIKPEFDVDHYKGVSIKSKKVKVNKKEIDEELDKLRQAYSQLQPIDDKDQTLTNDIVGTLDFVGTIDGEPFPQGQASNYVLEFGKGHFLKEFEEKIEGMKAGDVRTIDVTFPNDYFNEDLKSKTAQFVVTLQAVHKKALPEIDDDFAKDAGHDNLEAFKTDIEKKLADNQEKSFKAEYAEQAMDFLIKKNKFDIPEGLVELEMKEGKKEKKAAERSIRGQFILEEIAKKEQIKIEPQDVETRFSELARMYQQPVDVIKKYYQENNLLPQLAGQMTLQKTLDFVVDNANLK